MDESKAAVAASQNVLSVIDLFSFFGSIASLALAILAIWLAFSFKRHSDKESKETNDLLIKIQTQTESTTKWQMAEMSKFNDVVRGNMFNNSSKAEHPSNEGLNVKISHNETGDTEK